MNSDYAERLGEATDRELKGLPELRAPRTLLPRVMAAIHQRAALPWYHQAWHAWPHGLQIASFSVLALMFGGLCFAGWELSHAGGVGEATQPLRQWFSGFETVWKTLAVIVQAMLLAAKDLGPLFIAVCVFAGIATYVSCLALGTAFVRLAVARR